MKLAREQSCEGWARLAVSLLFFGVGKGTVALGPLAIAPLLGTAGYGGFEWALATGGLIAFLTDAGFSNAYPYYLLRDRDLGAAASAVSWHRWVLPTVYLPAIALSGNASSTLRLSIAFAAAFSVTRFAGVALKAKGRPELAIAAESSPYAAILLVAALAHIGWLPVTDVSLSLLTTSFAIYAGVTVLIHWRSRRWEHPITPATLRRAGKHAVAVWPAAAALVAVTLSVRVLGPIFLNAHDYGTFALHFRIASGLLLLHQLAITVRFEKVYTADAHRFQAFHLGLMSATALSGIALTWAAPTVAARLAPGLGSFFPALIAANACLIGLWSSCSALEMIVYRDRLERWQIIGAMFSGAILIVATFAGWRGLPAYLSIQAAALGTLAGFQIVAAMRNGSIKSLAPLSAVVIFASAAALIGFGLCCPAR